MKAWFIMCHLSFRMCSGIAAATMFFTDKITEVSESQLRVAFDGDAVLFSDESERIFKTHGLDKFFEHERENEDILLDHVCIILSTFSFCDTSNKPLKPIKEKSLIFQRMANYLKI